MNQPINSTLTWNSASTATGYNVSVATDTGFTNIVRSDSTANTFDVVSSLSYNTTFYWKVQAKNVGGAGAWSSYIGFTTIRLSTFPLQAGWNMLSMNVHPTDSAIATILGSLNGFVMAKNERQEEYIGRCMAPTQ